MRTTRQPIVAAALAILLWAQQTAAQATEWKFDQAHSNFYFDIQHIYSTIRGYFPDYSGTFLFDPSVPEQSKIHFEIKAKSIQTANEQRDAHLLSDAFFAAGKYPLITFDSTAIRKGGDNLYNVTGKLTIRDVTQEVTLPLTFLGEKDHPMDKKAKVAGFAGHLTLDRLQYHVGDGSFYKMGAIGKDVTITVSLEMLRSK